MTPAAMRSKATLPLALLVLTISSASAQWEHDDYDDVAEERALFGMSDPLQMATSNMGMSMMQQQSSMKKQSSMLSAGSSALDASALRQASPDFFGRPLRTSQNKKRQRYSREKHQETLREKEDMEYLSESLRPYLRVARHAEPLAGAQEQVRMKGVDEHRDGPVIDQGDTRRCADSGDSRLFSPVAESDRVPMSFKDMELLSESLRPYLRVARHVEPPAGSQEQARMKGVDERRVGPVIDQGDTRRGAEAGDSRLFSPVAESDRVPKSLKDMEFLSESLRPYLSVARQAEPPAGAQEQARVKWVDERRVGTVIDQGDTRRGADAGDLRFYFPVAGRDRVPMSLKERLSEVPALESSYDGLTGIRNSNNFGGGRLLSDTASLAGNVRSHIHGLNKGYRTSSYGDGRLLGDTTSLANNARSDGHGLNEGDPNNTFGGGRLLSDRASLASNARSHGHGFNGGDHIIISSSSNFGGGRLSNTGSFASNAGGRSFGSYPVAESKGRSKYRTSSWPADSAEKEDVREANHVGYQSALNEYSQPYMWKAPHEGTLQPPEDYIKLRQYLSWLLRRLH